jgi:hypothetical protein
MIKELIPEDVILAWNLEPISTALSSDILEALP